MTTTGPFLLEEEEPERPRPNALSDDVDDEDENDDIDRGLRRSSLKPNRLSRSLERIAQIALEALVGSMRRFEEARIANSRQQQRRRRRWREAVVTGGSTDDDVPGAADADAEANPPAPMRHAAEDIAFDRYWKARIERTRCKGSPRR